MIPVEFPRNDAPLDLVVSQVHRGLGFVEESWSFIGHSRRITADVYVPKAPWGVVIAAHGLNSDRRAPYIRGAAQAWARQGLALAAIDAPGHGERRSRSEVDPTWLLDPQTWVEGVGDLIRLRDALGVGTPTGALAVGYVGFSMGGMMGVPLFAIDEGRFSAGVIAIAGSARGLLGGVLPAIPPGLRDLLDRFDPVVFAPRVRIPVLMLVADKDETVPEAASRDLFDALGGERAWISFSGTHSQWDHPAQPYGHMFDFLRAKLARGGGDRSGRSSP